MSNILARKGTRGRTPNAQSTDLELVPFVVMRMVWPRERREARRRDAACRQDDCEDGMRVEVMAKVPMVLATHHDEYRV